MKKDNTGEFRGGLARFEDGHIIVKNFSAYWLEEIIHFEKIAGTLYIVDGTYEGCETLPSKLKRILANEEKSDSSE